MNTGYRVRFEFGFTVWEALMAKKPTWHRMKQIWRTIVEEARVRGPDAPRKHESATKLLSWFVGQRGPVKMKADFGFCKYTIKRERIW